ncbi:MAG: hypothetical protein ABI417_13650 [Coleofasciculaceae cyanobacterium]
MLEVGSKDAQARQPSLKGSETTSSSPKRTMLSIEIGSFLS